jgi:hypothetical protein
MLRYHATTAAKTTANASFFRHVRPGHIAHTEKAAKAAASAKRAPLQVKLE